MSTYERIYTCGIIGASPVAVIRHRMFPASILAHKGHPAFYKSLAYPRE